MENIFLYFKEEKKQKKKKKTYICQLDKYAHKKDTSKYHSLIVCLVK